MNKIILLLLLLSFSLLSAKEPTLGILQSIKSNTKQIFSIRNTLYLCDAYGILGVESLISNKSINKECQENIMGFYRKNPHARYFTESKLYKKQTYHIEFYKKECVLFAKGEMTLSELLLKEGFGVLKPEFEDKEFYASFKVAQENAKIKEKGIWKGGLTRDCIAEIYKK